MEQKGKIAYAHLFLAILYIFSFLVAVIVFWSYFLTVQYPINRIMAFFGLFLFFIVYLHLRNYVNANESSYSVLFALLSGISLAGGIAASIIPVFCYIKDISECYIAFYALYASPVILLFWLASASFGIKSFIISKKVQIGSFQEMPATIKDNNNLERTLRFMYFFWFNAALIIVFLFTLFVNVGMVFGDFEFIIKLLLFTSLISLIPTKKQLLKLFILGVFMLLSFRNGLLRINMENIITSFILLFYIFSEQRFVKRKNAKLAN